MSSIQDALDKAQREREASRRQSGLTDHVAVTRAPRRGRRRAKRGIIAAVMLVLGGVGAVFFFEREISALKAEVVKQVRRYTSRSGGESSPRNMARAPGVKREAPAPGRKPPPVGSKVPDVSPKPKASVAKVAKANPNPNSPARDRDMARRRAMAPQRAPTVPAVPGPMTLEDARRLREGGDLAGAEALLKSLIQEDPRGIDAIMALANLYLRDLGAPQEALSLYQRALAMDPSRASIHVNLGVYYLRAGDLDKAKQHMEEALELAPEMAEAHYNMACIQAVGGHYKEAEEAFIRAVRIDPRCAQWAQDDPDLASLHRRGASSSGKEKP